MRKKKEIENFLREKADSELSQNGGAKDRKLLKVLGGKESAAPEKKPRLMRLSISLAAVAAAMCVLVCSLNAIFPVGHDDETIYIGGTKGNRVDSSAKELNALTAIFDFNGQGGQIYRRADAITDETLYFYFMAGDLSYAETLSFFIHFNEEMPVWGQSKFPYSTEICGRRARYNINRSTEYYQFYRTLIYCIIETEHETIYISYDMHESQPSDFTIEQFIAMLPRYMLPQA